MTIKNIKLRFILRIISGKLNSFVELVEASLNPYKTTFEIKHRHESGILSMIWNFFHDMGLFRWYEILTMKRKFMIWIFFHDMDLFVVKYFNFFFQVVLAQSNITYWFWPILVHCGSLLLIVSLCGTWWVIIGHCDSLDSLHFSNTF